MLSIFNELNKLNLFFDNHLRKPFVSDFYSHYTVKQKDYVFNVKTSNKECLVELVKEGKSTLITIELPLTKDSKVKMQSTDSSGAQSVTEHSASDFVSKLEVPLELKDVFEKIKSYLKLNLNLMPNKEASVQESASDKPDTTSQEDSSKSFNLYKIVRKDDKTLQFEGNLIFSHKSELRNWRYFENLIFQTKGGSYVAVKIGRSFIAGESDQVATKVSKEQPDILEFFGKGYLSDKICRDLKWENPFIEIID